MGRLESLTVWALGRTPYEDEIVDGQRDDDGCVSAQQYNEHGHPRNPETKRREREHVRAANEVMQVTGVVEDAAAAKAKAKAYRLEKNQETFTGLRLIEAGRATLVGGVWGVLGLRRRILLYKPYSETGLFGILRLETALYSIPHLLLSGLPTVLAYHLSDWGGFVAQAFLDSIFGEDEENLTTQNFWLKRGIRTLLDVGFCYVTLHLRLFAILQQLNLIPATRLLPNFGSFIPFSASSPLQLPPSPSLDVSSVVSWGSALLRSAAPIIIILIHGKVKFTVSKLLYRPIYKSLPRPTGDSMFSGLQMAAPGGVEYDTPDRSPEDGRVWHGEDEPTLRALEGLPALDRAEVRSRQVENDLDSSDEEDYEMPHATLISFDVEATEAVETSLGTWSAELRSANESKPSNDIEYRVTGMTMLPPILATEGLREILAGVLVLPLEATMVRIIGRAYRMSSGLGVSDLYFAKDGIITFGNLFSAFAAQLAVTGVVWAGFTIGTSFWVATKRAMVGDKAVGNLEGRFPREAGDAA